MPFCPEKVIAIMTALLRRLPLKIIYPAGEVSEKSAKFIKYGLLVNSEIGLWCIMVIKTSRNRQEEAV